MKTKLLTFRQDCWQTLTEVPGWPNAPRKVRIRRTLPLVVPFVAMLLMLAWNKGVRDPHIKNIREAHQSLSVQESEIESLGLDCSDQQAADLATHAVQVARLILQDPQELGPVLHSLKQQAIDHHWDGAFQAIDYSGAAVAAETNLLYLPVRAKLTYSGKASEAFSTLLALLDQFYTAEKRIDLTRMGIRADEQGRYTVELNLRLVSRSPNEKTAQ